MKKLNSLRLTSAGFNNCGGRIVTLTNWVTFYDDVLVSRFLPDAPAGVYLQVTDTLALQAGQRVVVDGGLNRLERQ